MAFLASSAHAATISFTGTFQHDDNLAVFQYRVANQGAVTVATTSWAGGGFIPILSLFDSTGNFIFWSDGYALNNDASLGWVSDAGADYTVILSEYHNYPNLPTLADGYSMANAGDFTSLGPTLPGPFRDPSGAQLTGDWAVTFSSADPTLQAIYIPEPGAAALLIGGMLCVAWRFRRGARPKNN